MCSLELNHVMRDIVRRLADLRGLFLEVVEVEVEDHVDDFVGNIDLF